MPELRALALVEVPTRRAAPAAPVEVPCRKCGALLGYSQPDRFVPVGCPHATSHKFTMKCGGCGEIRVWCPSPVKP